MMIVECDVLNCVFNDYGECEADEIHLQISEKDMDELVCITMKKR